MYPSRIGTYNIPIGPALVFQLVYSMVVCALPSFLAFSGPFIPLLRRFLTHSPVSCPFPRGTLLSNKFFHHFGQDFTPFSAYII